ncbi:histidinol-phosphate transaminase [Secundilactobacillus paracollinoides]|uniref:Histidinol-phosphate aminotransferase n=1 Tax=Secundilactobacillus paracollinoides TaxID=240427 RepID=A0A1B2IY92_9LACO|nr:histidinol-phosphate transaminase [Secundilactobacillus paracollinoides]ANZ61078.1 histidinol-phosphate transaminase [Secundilactobacillus paracollinoides]ANZ64499.1 histidinol-phosphate transaminase [Secundilactobacillus paracollinoides]ANZ67001.1 histidinol-phosphate transaminase [Secundilactobacillus paracollinoides]
MVKKAIADLKPYTPEDTLDALKQREGLSKLVRLSANENAFGTSPRVAEALSKWGFTGANRYPDSNMTTLREAIASRLNVSADALVFGNGLDEILALLSRTLVEPGDDVIVAEPTFSEYALNAVVEGATMVDVSVDSDGVTDLASFTNAITPKTRMIWICNPNNPTGTFVSKAEIAAFMKTVPASVTVIVDEAYIDFTTVEDDPSALSLMAQFDNLVVLRTFSKAYGLANFRVGFAIVSPTLGNQLERVRLPYNLSTFTEIAATAAFQDQSFVTKTVTTVAAERKKWQQFLTDQGIAFYPSQANFIFFKVADADGLAATLLKNGYLLRSGLGDNWLRVTIGQPADNQAVQEIIAAFVK